MKKLLFTSIYLLLSILMFSQIVQSKPGRISELSRFFIFDDSNHKSFLLNKENTNGRYSSDEKPEDGF